MVASITVEPVGRNGAVGWPLAPPTELAEALAPHIAVARATAGRSLPPGHAGKGAGESCAHIFEGSFARMGRTALLFALSAEVIGDIVAMPGPVYSVGEP